MGVGKENDPSAVLGLSTTVKMRTGEEKATTGPSSEKKGGKDNGEATEEQEQDTDR